MKRRACWGGLSGVCVYVPRMKTRPCSRERCNRVDFYMMSLSMEDVGWREEGWLWGWLGLEEEREAVKVKPESLLLLMKLGGVCLSC